MNIAKMAASANAYRGVWESLRAGCMSDEELVAGLRAEVDKAGSGEAARKLEDHGEDEVAHAGLEGGVAGVAVMS